jgi:hypothetical protein
MESIWQLDGQWCESTNGCNHMHAYSEKNGGNPLILVWCYPSVLWESFQKISNRCSLNQAKSNLTMHWPALGVRSHLVQAKLALTKSCNGYSPTMPLEARAKHEVGMTCFIGNDLVVHFSFTMAYITFGYRQNNMMYVNV